MIAKIERGAFDGRMQVLHVDRVGGGVKEIDSPGEDESEGRLKRNRLVTIRPSGVEQLLQLYTVGLSELSANRLGRLVGGESSSVGMVANPLDEGRPKHDDPHFEIL